MKLLNLHKRPTYTSVTLLDHVIRYGLIFFKDSVIGYFESYKTANSIEVSNHGFSYDKSFI